MNAAGGEYGPVTSHLEVLAERVALAGLHVLDVGAGDGAFARQLAAAGARVTALEIDADKVATAGTALADYEVTLRQGVAEALPLADASVDLVCFMFSFHHVPLPQQDRALTEAARVLRSGGRLHVVDPLATGAMTEVLAPVDDETEVRNASQARLSALTGGEFELLDQRRYQISRRYPSVQALIDSVIAVDPDRAARLPAARAEVERRFAHYAGSGDQVKPLLQPCVQFHFARV